MSALRTSATHDASRDSFVERLRRPGVLTTVELRPPKAGLTGTAGIDAWIDMRHAVRRLIADGRFVLVTDNAVGAHEEENLAHLNANVSEPELRSAIVPFLTCKHPLEYCLVYAERAAAAGFEALTVVGGDRSIGLPRCLPHAYMLREKIRARVPRLALGGWANPHRDPKEQAEYLASGGVQADFFLTQVLSHHSADRAADLLRELERLGVELPAVFGVFYYRSASPVTLTTLGRYFPVPAQEIMREFESGAGADEICARSIRALRNAGVERFYVSNLGLSRPAAALARILERV